MSKAFFIDVQGTLIDDNKNVINGACEFIKLLNKKDIPYVVITNNTKEKSDIFLQKLKSKGLEIKNYIDPFSILNETVSSKNIAAFGTDMFLKVLKEDNFNINFEKFDSLVVSIKEDYTNEDYSQMIECAYKAKEIIAMHETSTYSKNGKRYPGVGAIINMIKFAVNKEYKVVGKPSLSFYGKAKDLISCEFKDITVISDDMIGDLIGAQKLGMNTALVLSGKVRNKNEIYNLEENAPKTVCKDMSEIIKLFEEGKL